MLALQRIFPAVKHVKDLELQNASDRRIWTYAKENKYTIVTFDSDFYDMVTLFGHPPKIIWLRCGNILTVDLVKFFELHFKVISSFINDPINKDVACLQLG